MTRAAIRPAAMVLAALLLGGAAGGPPPLRPLRDASVLYEVEVAAGGAPRAVSRLRMSWQAATGALRVEPDGPAGWMLVDTAAGRAVLVLDAQRGVVSLPPAAAAELGNGFPAGTGFRRAGSAEFAGRACALWRVSVPAHGERTLCLTADGLMLSTDAVRVGGRPARLRAVAVDEGAQDPARFRVPPDYRPMRPPAP